MTATAQPAQVGNQVGGITFNGDAGIVIEEMTWYKHGRLKSHTTKTQWSDDTTDGPFTVSYDYDNLGNTTVVDYPALDGVDFSTLQYQYNGLSQVTQISDQDDNFFAAFQYDTTGNPIITTFGAPPITGALTYNSPGKLIDVSSGDFNSAVTFNFDGTVHTQNEALPGGTAPQEIALTFGYDEFACLSSAEASSNEQTQGFGFTNPDGVQDLNSNIWTITGAGSAGFDYTAGTNQLYQATWESGATTAYEYLLNGSLNTRTSAPSAPADLPDLAFTYAKGSTQTASVTVGDDTLVEFVYDCNGNRVGKRVSQAGSITSKTASIAGPMRPLAQIDESGAATAFVYGPKGLVAMARGNTRYGVAVDRLGSTRAVFNPDGSLAAAYGFLAFGGFALRHEPSAGWMPLLFTGQEFDSETGLYNFNARLYDPSACRFCAVDAAQQFPSPYLYVGNHPTAFTDPTGNDINAAEQVGIAMGALLFIGVGLAIACVPMLIPGMAALEGFALVAAYAVFGAVGGAVSGAASSGLYYDATHNPNDWSTSSFLNSLWIGAVGGAISGGISGGIIGVGTDGVGAEKAGAKAVRESTGELGAGASGDPTSVNESPASSTASSVKSASQSASEQFKKIMPYRLGGNVAGYFVSGLVTTPLSNYFVYHVPTTWAGMAESLGGDVLLGGFMAGLSGGFSYVASAFELSTALNPNFTSINAESMLWGSIVGGSALIAGTVGYATGFMAVNAVMGNWYADSSTTGKE
ncbi:MAG: RHS repeat-associated core domain-containing protein [Blastocatellia bacterium]